MHERLQITSFTIADPTEGAAVSTLHYYWDCLYDITIVGVSAAPQVADPGATLDIDDDGSNVISGVVCATVAVPGTWKSTYITGGAETPVQVAAGSKVSFDINLGANGTAFHVVLYYLLGSVST